MIRFAFPSLLVLAFAAPAMAQEARLPGFTLTDVGPMMAIQKTIETPTGEQAFKDVDNQQMRSVLYLQNQIIMINALTNWQSQVSRLQETYEEMGLSFTPPLPPRRICEQVPQNAVCADAYSDLAPAAPAPVAAAETTATATPATVSVEAPPLPPAAPAPQYEWADIQCMGDDCRATVIDLSSSARVTVAEGEQIADAVFVQDISANGVVMRIDGKANPIPSSDQPALMNRGGSVSGTTTSDGLKDALSANIPTMPDSLPVDSAAIVLDDGASTAENAAGAPIDINQLSVPGAGDSSVSVGDPAPPAAAPLSGASRTTNSAPSAAPLGSTGLF